MKISELSISLKERGGVKKWFVVDSSDCPLGAARDFYSESLKVPMGVLQNPYPFKGGQDGSDKEEDARALLDKTRKHMESVIEIPIKKRIGSSKWWSH